MKCKDCKYWNKWEEHGEDFGECQRSKCPESLMFGEHSAPVSTSADFGCVLFEAKK